jgi:hypothetical protein
MDGMARTHASTPALRDPALWSVVCATGGGGAVALIWLGLRTPWTATAIAQVALVALLVAIAGLFPIPVAPRVKAAATTAPVFAAVLLLPPGAAALAAGLGTLGCHLGLRLRPSASLRVPFYKYPFNLGESVLTAGVGSAVWQLLDGGLAEAHKTVAVAGLMYMLNTGLVSAVAGVQMRVSPLRLWWIGTRSGGGLSEACLYALGYLGAVAYAQGPWTLAAFVLPVAAVYRSFSRLDALEHPRESHSAPLVPEAAPSPTRSLVDAAEPVAAGVSDRDR